MRGRPAANTIQASDRRQYHQDYYKRNRERRREYFRKQYIKKHGIRPPKEPTIPPIVKQLSSTERQSLRQAMQDFFDYYLLCHYVDPDDAKLKQIEEAVNDLPAQEKAIILAKYMNDAFVPNRVIQGELNIHSGKFNELAIGALYTLAQRFDIPWRPQNPELINHQKNQKEVSR